MCVDTLLPYVGGGGGTISHATTALRGVDCIDTLLPELEGRSRECAVVTLLPYGVRLGGCYQVLRWTLRGHTILPSWYLSLGGA